MLDSIQRQLLEDMGIPVWAMRAVRVAENTATPAADAQPAKMQPAAPSAPSAAPVQTNASPVAETQVLGPSVALERFTLHCWSGPALVLLTPTLDNPRLRRLAVDLVLAVDAPRLHHSQASSIVFQYPQVEDAVSLSQAVDEGRWQRPLAAFVKRQLAREAGADARLLLTTDVLARFAEWLPPEQYLIVPSMSQLDGDAAAKRRIWEALVGR